MDNLKIMSQKIQTKAKMTHKVFLSLLLNTTQWGLLN